MDFAQNLPVLGKRQKFKYNFFFYYFSVQNIPRHVITIIFPIEYYSKLSMGKCQFFLRLGAQNRNMKKCVVIA